MKTLPISQVPSTAITVSFGEGRKKLKVGKKYQVIQQLGRAGQTSTSNCNILVEGSTLTKIRKNRGCEGYTYTFEDGKSVRDDLIGGKPMRFIEVN